MNESNISGNRTTQPKGTPTAGGRSRWQLPALLVIVLVAVVPVVNHFMNRREVRQIAPSADENRSAAAKDATTTGQAVSLTVEFADRPARNWPDIAWRDALIIGLAQALALFPGISRSGMTIGAGLFVGLKREAAARFSFLMATPIILGAGIWKGRELLGGGLAADDALPLAVGLVAAALSGVS